MDATLVSAQFSTTNDSGQRDPEMHQTKKGNQWYFGMKGHGDESRAKFVVKCCYAPEIFEFVKKTV